MHTECLTASALKVLKTLKKIVLTDNFVLAGGTGIALQLGHRKSADFDFFTDRSFSNEKLFRKIRFLDFDVQTLQEEQGTLTLTASGVKVSFSQTPYPFLDEPVRLKGIPIAGLIDIASMKILAITQRGAKRDFVDLYFILQNVPFRKIAMNMIGRFGSERINPVVTGKALVYFRDAESDPEPEYLTKKREWKTIKKFYADHVQQFVLDLDRMKKERGE